VIGLRRHTVRLAEHELAWAELFAREAEAMRGGLADLAVEIEHVGSTAVPGLAAKPILDIAIGVTRTDDIPIVVERLAGAGYIDRGHAGRNGGHLLIRESAPDIRTVHAHIVEVADRQWSQYLWFRNTLRADSATRRAYAELKHRLARAFANDRGAYTAGKETFIRSVLERHDESWHAAQGGQD
jgi:GrpB-like predicted nucleotidyltransferase (UPF0157 family)